MVLDLISACVVSCRRAAAGPQQDPGMQLSLQHYLAAPVIDLSVSPSRAISSFHACLPLSAGHRHRDRKGRAEPRGVPARRPGLCRGAAAEAQPGCVATLTLTALNTLTALAACESLPPLRRRCQQNEPCAPSGDASPSHCSASSSSLWSFLPLHQSTAVGSDLDPACRHPKP